MAKLFATKPMNLLMEEAGETGGHSLKRTLGVFQLTALGVGAIIGAGTRGQCSRHRSAPPSVAWRRTLSR